MASAQTDVDAAVVGGGPAGLVAALALARAGVQTLLVAPAAIGQDRRTTALLGGSVEALEGLGVWTQLADHAAPLEHLRLVDATRRLLRAPEIKFSATEVGLAAFGHNIENAHLIAALWAAARAESRICWRGELVHGVEPAAHVVELSLPSGSARARLVIGADGRNSPCRTAAGIDVDHRELPQAALVANFRHSRPHGNISTEFHTESGPFTLVPLPGQRSSLVCVVEQDEADALLALDDAALSREVEVRARSILGKMEVTGERTLIPLGFSIAGRMAARRIALVGEAGHVLPPIGAQGLNLGIRDAVAIAELVARAIKRGEDPGGGRVLDGYEQARRNDVRARAMIVDWMNRSLLSDFLPMHLARGVGLYLAARIGPLRRFLMRQGLGPASETPARH